MYEGHWFGGGFMWLFWILLIVVVLWVVKTATGNGDSNAASAKSASALEILKERYARGEIDLEEFENKKKHLAD